MEWWVYSHLFTIILLQTLRAKSCTTNVSSVIDTFPVCSFWQEQTRQMVSRWVLSTAPVLQTSKRAVFFLSLDFSCLKYISVTTQVGRRRQGRASVGVGRIACGSSRTVVMWLDLRCRDRVVVRRERGGSSGRGAREGGRGSSEEHLVFAGSRGHVEAVLCGGPYILVPGTLSRRGVGVAWER